MEKMDYYFSKSNLLSFLFLVITLLYVPSSIADISNKKIKIAVRAHSGENIAIQKWSATADYLTQAIEGYSFELIPLVGFDKMHQAVLNEEVDFVLINPGTYIELEAKYGVSKIATLINQRGINATRKFGAVIFTRSDSQDIQNLTDIKGRSIMGVAREAFGGWRMALGELINHDIDPYKVCSQVLFEISEQQEPVVRAVRDGKVDVGTVRTGIMERLAKNGEIELNDFRILGRKDDDFSLPHSTNLYPEWPFAKLNHVQDSIAQKVVVALFSMEPSHKAAQTGNYTGWTTPLDCILVHNLMRQLRVGPYKEYSKVTFEDTLKKYWYWLVLIIAGLSFSVLITLYVTRTNRRLIISRSRMEQEIEERKQIEAKLKASEERSRTWLEHSPVCTKIVDLDFNLQYMSSAGIKALRMDDVTPFYGKPYPFDFYPDSFKVPMTSNLKKTRATGEITAQEASVVDIDGSELWFHSTIVPVNDDKGRIDYIIVVSIDITERKKAETEKENLENRLSQAQKMEALGTVAGGIAHDFNNILGAILGYAEMAKEDAPPGTRFEKDLEKVLIAANRAKELVKQILAFSRQTRIERIPIKIQPLIKEGLKMLRSSIPTTISITQDIDPESGIILADPTQVQQVLINLCTNAYHAMEKNGGELSVTLKTTFIGPDKQEILLHVSPGEYLEFTVSDTGSGIRPDVIGKIFDPYFTTNKIGEGTGMGLAIIHGIVSDYGGTITVESELGKGSSFHVYFPVVEKDALPKIKKLEDIPEGKERILFIDDEELLAEMGRDMLERLGYHVTVRCSSIEALTTFQNTPNEFDIVITDQTMPGMTGSDLARRMMQVRPDIPIILCTGYSNLIDEHSAKALGIKEFAFKPIAKNDLAKLIRKVLDG